jgi:serine/threonine-protein kinase
MQLARILASPLFRNSKRRSQLLSFVVSQTLAGHAADLKEYVLGIGAFDRPKSFDPRLDPIVRVQASSLRAKLRKYYDDAGRGDPVLIELPRGSYVPRFEKRAEVSMPTDEDHPPTLGPSNVRLGDVTTIAILRFLDLSPAGDHQRYCDGITEELLNALSEIPGLRVVARASAFELARTPADVIAIAMKLAVDIVLEGSFRRDGDNIRVAARLFRATDGYVVCSRNFDAPCTDAICVQEKIARAIAASVKMRVESTPGLLPCQAM